MDFHKKFILEKFIHFFQTLHQLIFLRICFGALNAMETSYIFHINWIEHLYAKAPFHFNI